MKSSNTASVLFAMALLAGPLITLAHTDVWPHYADVGSFQTFNISVPSEENLATTQIRIVLPEGLSYVTPTIKTGWTIETITAEENPKTATSHRDSVDQGVTEITWKGGSIPAHQRDDFSFSAKVPDRETTLSWKIYQTYKGGKVVAWELGPKDTQPKTADGKSDFSAKGPLSQTVVARPVTPSPKSPSFFEQPYVALGLSALAVLFSIVALMNAGKKRY